MNKVQDCSTCRYQQFLGSDLPGEQACDYCSIIGNSNESNWRPPAKVPCADCEVEEGVWDIEIKKEFQGTFGKHEGLFCDKCLIYAIEGYHSGGGMNSYHIKKIVRMRDE